MFRNILFTKIFIASFAILFGQQKPLNPIPDIRQGNKQFNSQKYEEAEISFRKALEKDPKNKEAIYNLGTAQYQQKKFEDAIESFKKSTENYSTKSEGIDAKMMKAASYHNLGNAYLLKQDASNAIEAYKNALKLNPTDLDTKYNLVFALQEKKKQDQNKDGKGDKNKDDKKEGKGDKNQNKDGNKKEGGDKGDEKKEGEGKDGKGDEKGQEEKPKPGQLSKEQAEKLLDALQNQEKKTQEKMQKIKGKPTPVKVEKDW